MNRCWRVLLPLLPFILLACSGDTTSAPAGPIPRTFRLGFSAVPPRPTNTLVLATLAQSLRRSDIGLIQPDVPWAALLADSSAGALVTRDQLPLAQIFRGHQFPLVVMVEPANGLARDRESDALTALGRSITEPAVQAAYQRYVLALDSVLHPEYLGLVIESNLIRTVAPARIYDALRTMANATASALRARHSSARLLVSVQVETAWGRLPAGAYRGIAADLTDFPFVDALGLSSYPFLAGFAQPEDVPGDYYARIAAQAQRPVLVTEGGWSSESVPGVTSTPATQARWIERQMQLADSARARAVLQIPFTDLDMSAWGSVPEAQTLAFFAHIGLVDAQLVAKPALAPWDSAYQRPLASGH